MDPSQFPISKIPLKHAPYGPITREAVGDANRGKVAVVTGAGRGIGQAISVSLAASGANVAILDLKLDNLNETKAKVEELGVKCLAYECDVVDEKRVREVFASVEQDLGPVDILVNNAGMLYGKPTHAIDFAEYWRTVEVNYKGPMICTLSILPSMRSRPTGGCIITIASRAATVDTLLALGYNDAKAAITRATHSLQLEFDTASLPIHTYALHPGGVATAMGSSGHRNQWLEGYDVFENSAEFKTIFKDPPELCGQTCAWLGSGRGRELRGLYLDCRQDLDVLLGYGAERLRGEGRNVLKVDFCEGYGNEP